MTNYEHMTDEEKKKALYNGLYINTEGKIGICEVPNCKDFICQNLDICERYCFTKETRIKWLDAEYVPQKTENEKFCETLKVGEVIVVWNDDDVSPRVRVFQNYEEKDDAIRCISDGNLEIGVYYINYLHGRKLTAKEKGE